MTEISGGWTIEPVRLEGGLVGLVIKCEHRGRSLKMTIVMDRPDSRELARAILQTGGDATERSFTGGSGHG